MEAVESVCNYLPGDYKAQCDSLIETYGKEIIDAINKDIAPDNLCKYIGLCPKAVSLMFCYFKKIIPTILSTVIFRIIISFLNETFL